MEVAKYTNDLDELLSKDSITDSDVLHFVKSLVRLSNDVKIEKNFGTFGPVVNQWIRAYKQIFSEKKIDDSAKICIRKSGKVLTYVFLSLMQTFDSHEGHHSLEFYGQWKQIISAINPRKLAEYVCRHGQEFKSLIENLRTATNRCDQLSILAVLLMYTEQLSSDKLKLLKENSNSYILDKLAILNTQPNLLLNQHSFLHDIDAMGHSIISLKPTKIIGDEISLSLNTSVHALWIDFNMRENSITLVAVSPTQNAITFLATLSRPKLKERLSDEHELKIRGAWSVINGPAGLFQKRITVNVYLPIHDRNAVWKAKVKSIFRFVPDTSIHNTQSISSQESMQIDQRFAQFAAHGFDDRRYGMSQKDESFTSYSLSGSQFQRKSITPVAHMQLDADQISSFRVDPANAPATKNCIENCSLIDESKIERNRLADLPIEEIFFGPIRDPLNDKLRETLHDPLRDPLNDSLRDPLNDLLDDPLLDEPFDDHHSDHSSGISFGNDISVMDHDQSENEIDCHSANGNSKCFGASSHKSFSSANSSVSAINKQVKRFIEGTQNRSGHQSSQPLRKQHTDEIMSTANRLPVPNRSPIVQITDSIRDIIGGLSAASIDKPNEERSKSTPAEDSTFEKLKSFNSQPVRSTSVMPPTETEHANGDVAVELQDGLMRTSPSKDIFSKAYPSNERRRNATKEKQLGEDIFMADCHDDQGVDRTDASANLQSNMSLLSNEADEELVFDEEEMVFDKRGCVFVNNDELEDALYVYMENNGLEYLRSESFKTASAERRLRSEREFRAIHKLINRKFEDAAYSPNRSITATSHGKHKLWNSLDDRSTCSSPSEIYQQPTKKFKDSEASLGNGTNAVVAAAELKIDGGKLQGVSCAMTQLNALIDYLKDFFETRETCEIHRVKLLHLITEIQANNIKALSGKEPYSTTLANIRTLCQEAREFASMVIHGKYKQ